MEIDVGCGGRGTGSARVRYMFSLKPISEYIKVLFIVFQDLPFCFACCLNYTVCCFNPDNKVFLPLVRLREKTENIMPTEILLSLSELLSCDTSQHESEVCVWARNMSAFHQLYIHWVEQVQLVTNSEQKL